MAVAVTVTPGKTTTVLAGGTAVEVIPPNVNGGIITNPISKDDQGVALAEPLYVNPINQATLSANVTTFALAPGATWTVVPGQSSSTWVNAASNGHKFSAVYW